MEKKLAFYVIYLRRFYFFCDFEIFLKNSQFLIFEGYISILVLWMLFDKLKQNYYMHNELAL